jgi:hypothetical protein
MATIYADAQGNLLRFLKTPVEEARYPDPPAGATQKVTFDGATNASVFAGIDSDWNSHRVVSNVLHRNGTPVTIAPDSPAATVLAALQAGTATDVQVQQVLAVLLARYLKSN